MVVAPQYCPMATAIAAYVPDVFAEAGVAGRRAPKAAWAPYEEKNVGTGHSPLPRPAHQPGKLTATSTPSLAAPGSWDCDHYSALAWSHLPLWWLVHDCRLVWNDIGGVKGPNRAHLIMVTCLPCHQPSPWERRHPAHVHQISRALCAGMEPVKGNIPLGTPSIRAPALKPASNPSSSVPRLC